MAGECIDAGAVAAIGAVGSWAQAVAGFAGAGAVIYAAHKGVATVQSWFGQKRAERQVEAAERILALAYRLQREFQAIRSPAQFQGEIDRAEKLLTEGDPNFAHADGAARKRLMSSQVYISRLVARAALWDELFACAPLAKAYFGDKAEAALMSFWVQRGFVDTAARMLAGELPRELQNKLEGDIWEGWNAAMGVEDRISVALAAALADLETALLPVLRVEDQPAAAKIVAVAPIKGNS